jgi:hypothetical protein
MNVPIGPSKQCATPEKMSSISGYTLTEDLPGTNTFLQNGNNQESPSPTCKLLIYKTILKPFWAYGIQLWGMASTSNTEILECFQ